MPRATTLLLLAATAAGCGGPAIAPTPVDHPAHPGAAGAPPYPVSSTLAVDQRPATAPARDSEPADHATHQHDAHDHGGHQ